MKIELWSSDLFDRDSTPSLEAGFSTIPEGLKALWDHVLGEGVQDDGRPTFTDFQLRLEGKRPISLPRDPHANPALAALRRCRQTPLFLDELVAVHAARLDRPFDFAPFLALCPSAR